MAGTSGKPHAVIDLVDRADRGGNYVSSGSNALRAISASEAFRKYNWLSKLPVTNASGNFRGMVVSARWRTVYQVTSDVGDVLDKVTLFVGLATNIVQSAPQIEAIAGSNDSWEIKGAKISTQVSSIALRTVGGGIPFGVHLFALSLEGYCRIAGLITGPSWGAPNQALRKLQMVDGFVQTKFNAVTDGNNIYTFVNTHLTPN